MVAGDDAQPIFFYDLGSPASYLAAETVMSGLATVPEWQPVDGAAFPGRDPASECELVERLGPRHGLQPLCWPALPADTHQAMLAATYAKQIGRAVAFSLAAFRQAFAGGRDLGELDTILIAAAACEMHPTAVIKGIGLRSVAASLARAGERARAAGVTLLPAIVAGERTFQGAMAVELATQEHGVSR